MSSSWLEELLAAAGGESSALAALGRSAQLAARLQVEAQAEGAPTTATALQALRGDLMGLNKESVGALGALERLARVVAAVTTDSSAPAPHKGEQSVCVVWGRQGEGLVWMVADQARQLAHARTLCVRRRRPQFATVF